MEQDFYKARLKQLFDLEVIVPKAEDRRIVHEIIYKELVAGKVFPKSQNLYREIIARLVAEGAQAIILGCTEIMLLVSDEDSAVPLFDTTTIHYCGRRSGVGSDGHSIGVLIDVRFTPKSGHHSARPPCPLCAKSRHPQSRWTSKQQLWDCDTKNNRISLD